MTTRLPVLIILGVLGGAWPAGAACGRFGTQLECAFSASQVVIGTQTADDPSHARSSIRPQPFHGGNRLLRDGAAPAKPFQLGLQNIGIDPSLCRKIGNETYCY